jgi:hypothetical protein
MSTGQPPRREYKNIKKKFRIAIWHPKIHQRSLPNVNAKKMKPYKKLDDSQMNTTIMTKMRYFI